MDKFHCEEIIYINLYRIVSHLKYTIQLLLFGFENNVVLHTKIFFEMILFRNFANLLLVRKYTEETFISRRCIFKEKFIC